MRKITKIILHHSLTKDGSVVDWQAIRKYHIETQKWFDVGYHFGIEKINKEYEVLIGRPLQIEGAHTKGQNSDSIGICFIGNYDIAEPEKIMIEIALKRIILPLCLFFNLRAKDIYGHKDFAQKTCPGKKFDLEKIRQPIRDIFDK